jgi:hypothetical protein
VKHKGDLHIHVDPFKRCSLCSREWKTREDFLSDRENHYDGYQPSAGNGHEKRRTKGLLIFTHCRCSCGTSLAILGSRYEMLSRLRHC